MSHELTNLPINSSRMSLSVSVNEPFTVCSQWIFSRSVSDTIKKWVEYLAIYVNDIAKIPMWTDLNRINFQPFISPVTPCWLQTHANRVPYFTIFTVRNEVAKVMFLQTPVCPQGGCLPQCMVGYHTPPGADPPSRHPRSRHPPEQTPPGSRHPPPPWEQTPPPRADTPQQTPPMADTPQE